MVECYMKDSRHSPRSRVGCTTQVRSVFMFCSLYEARRANYQLALARISFATDACDLFYRLIDAKKTGPFRDPSASYEAPLPGL